MNIEEIRERITELSGSGKRVVSTRRHGLYSSFTLPGLDDMVSVRDTRTRFLDFGVEDNLSNKRVLDLGSNVGAMAFEAANRGGRVSGVEFRADRVRLCEEISAFYEMNPRPQFYQCDLNTCVFEDQPWYRKYDIVLCCSVTEYIDGTTNFFGYLAKLAKQLYLEDNIQDKYWQVEDTLSLLERSGFNEVAYLGNGHSGGISRKRKLYRARQG